MQVTNLRLKYPGESSFVFKDLTFEVSPGQKVLLLGPSGCGKSTLLQVLSGIIPNSIEVPHKYESIDRPDSWGFVFQDPDTQFCMPFVDEELAFVLENLSVPRDRMQPLIVEALSRVGLMLEDLHTSIHTLSQGMKQRLALASVLLLQPDVLFLDEPSALLDPEGTEQIWAAVKNSAPAKTIVIVEHKIEHIYDYVDRVVLFNDSGEMIADGLPNDVFAVNTERLREYGIWHPNVWNDYVASKSYRQIESGRKACSSDEPARKEPIMSLREFKGLRVNQPKITVPQASAAKSDWIAVVGPNGAGKSTLLLSIMQLLQTSGTYELFEEAVPPPPKRLSKSAPPRRLAFVFQNPELQFLTNSLYEELAYSLRLAATDDERIGHKVQSLLEKFNLRMDRERHPFQLSTGEKRRLSVATALSGDQPVLLLDEPTFGQDAKNTIAILETLERLRLDGTTIIMVTHDMQIVKHFATKVWSVEDGLLTELLPDDAVEASHHAIVHTS